MIVVADSSAIVVLVNIGVVELLPALFGRVLIPPAVSKELASEKRPSNVRAFIGSRPEWLEIRSVRMIDRIPGLDDGESSAIALALEVGADRVIMDESAGRRAASERNVRVIGTIGILIAAAELGMIDLGTAFERIKTTDFWVSPRFLDEQLAAFRKRIRHSEG